MDSNSTGYPKQFRLDVPRGHGYEEKKEDVRRKAPVERRKGPDEPGSNSGGDETHLQKDGRQNSPLWKEGNRIR